MPQTFKDCLDREWIIKVSIPLMKRVEKDVGVRLQDLFSSKSEINKIDIVKQADIILACVDEQLMEQGIIEDEFLESLNLRAIEEGFTALLLSYADFLPEREGKELAKIFGRAKERVRKRQDALLDKDVSDEAIDEALDQMLGAIE